MGSTPVKLIVVVCAVLGLSACSTNWATWGFSNTRQGRNNVESTITTGNVSGLQQVWATSLGGNVNAAPVVATGVLVESRRIDIAYLGDEHGGFTAINVADGSVVWSKNFGTQTLSTCAESPDGIFGTSDAAVIDQNANRVYVAGADGAVHALDLATGAEASGWPVSVTSIPTTEFVEGALALSNGRIYVPIASHCDIGPYTGRVTAIDVAGPTISHIFWITPQGQDLKGSVWGWGGVSIDPATNDVYFATGNGPTYTAEDIYYADSVVRATRDLDLVASNRPPRTRDNDDFGSTPVLFTRSGCPPQLAVLRKDGNLYLYDRDTIASGPQQAILVSTSPLLGVAAYDSTTNLLYVATSRNSLDGTYHTGLQAFTVQSDCTLALAWEAAVPANASPTTSAPVVANGVVYYGDGGGNTLRAFDAATGAALWNSGSDVTGAIYAEPIVVNGTVLAGAWDGKLHAWRLPSG